MWQSCQFSKIFVYLQLLTLQEGTFENVYILFDNR